MTTMNVWSVVELITACGTIHEAPTLPLTIGLALHSRHQVYVPAVVVAPGNFLVIVRVLFPMPDPEREPKSPLDKLRYCAPVGLDVGLSVTGATGTTVLPMAWLNAGVKLVTEMLVAPLLALAEVTQVSSLPVE